MQAINKETINDILKAPAAVLDFWASWCGPCRMLSPIVEELAAKYEGKIEFGSVNVDDEEELAVSYGISVIPTLIFMKNGQAVKKTVGVKSASELEGILEDLIR